MRETIARIFCRARRLASGALLASAGETIDAPARPQEFGFANNPPSPATAHCAAINGNPAQTVILVTDHAASGTPAPAVGECAIYALTASGAAASSIVMKANGEIHITGNITLTGTLTASGNIHTSADATAGSISLKNHTHPVPGCSATQKPT